MSSDILAVLEYMEKEKGISRDDMISTIVNAILSGAQKGVHANQELKIEINPKTGALKAKRLMTCVDSVSDSEREIHVEKARGHKSDAQLGDVLELDTDAASLGRIAAQAARQAIMQRLRQFEKERIFDDFKDLVGDIVTGTVRRRERSDLIIDLGKAEAILPSRERVPGEDYSPGERIRCLLLEIESTNRGPELILSRASNQFVKRLFELEVAEIADGTVTIEGFAREPGYRTKVAVHSHDPKVDPVGACVGARGARVKSIVRELSGEKIDIVRFFTDPKSMLEEALRPAVPRNISIDSKSKRIYFEVNEEDLSVAIGRKGLNARLTSKLMGWRLDIGKETKQETGFDERKQAALQGWVSVEGIDESIASRLIDCGLVSPETFSGVEASDLEEAGFTTEEATNLVSLVQQHRTRNQP